MYKEKIEQEISVRNMVSHLIPSVTMTGLGMIIRYLFPDSIFSLAALFTLAAFGTKLAIPVVQRVIVLRHRLFHRARLHEYAKDIQKYKNVMTGDFPDYIVLYGMPMLWEMIEGMNNLSQGDKEEVSANVMGTLENYRIARYDIPNRPEEPTY